jgi:hypothetical protein
MTAARILHIRPLGVTDRFLYAETTAGRAIVPATPGLLAAAGAVDVVPEGTRLTPAQIDALGISGIHPSRLPLPLLSDDLRLLQPIGLPRKPLDACDALPEAPSLRA